MRILLNWLRELCPTDLDPAGLAEVLTKQGVKVESVDRPWAGLSGVLVARVLQVRDHPRSEKLCVTEVDAGEGVRQVVAGVRNMRPGDLVPYAPPGSRVPALPEPLAERRLRGEPSQGMLCSPWELGVSPLHLGILVLPTDAPVGADVKALYGLDDVRFDIEVKSNRPDLLSVAGVAREAAAATGAPFTSRHERPPESSSAKAGDAATVEVLDLERCPRYLARIIRGVAIGPSPVQVQARLTAAGMRPVSNVVDATNYVMLEMGQPMHPFDVALLDGSGIVVRRAREGERLVTLDDAERTLSADDLVIADRSAAVGIAGVMGSAAAEVGEATRDILLESAHFEKLGIRRTASRLGLQTEASTRFGRGADPEAVEPAAARAAGLMVAWGGGEVLRGVIDVGTVPARRVVAIRPGRAASLLGDHVAPGDVREVFDRLGMSASGGDEAIDVEIPGHRPDLEIEVDLIEEVARLRRYDRIPERLPGVRQPGGVATETARRAAVRERLVRAGLRETMSFSFASAADLDLMAQAPSEAVAVANPLDAQESFLRASLVPALLRAAAWNAARGATGVALFEVGHVFRLGAGPDEPVDEREVASAVLTGSASPGWPDAPRHLDFFDAKGAMTALLEGVGGWSLAGPAGPPFHPGRSARVLVAGRDAGALGELHPRIAEGMDLPRRVGVFEVDLDVMPAATGFVAYRAVSRFPPVRRDLAFLVDTSVPAEAVADGIVRAADGLAGPPVLFDVFEGEPLPPGRRNVAYAVEFRASDRTLTAEEVDAAVRRIAEHLAAAVGAELRTS